MPIMGEKDFNNKDKEIEEITLVAFKYGESLFPSKYAFFNDETNEELPFAWLFYLIRFKGHNILVDTGVSDLNELEKYGFHLHSFSEPIKLIENYGLKLEEITDVIITHSDFDHIADINYYINADIYIQEEEFQKYKDKIVNTGKIITFVDTINVHDKFTVKRIGGHTKGSSIITFKYGESNYILAGDECYLYASLEKEIPVGRSYDVEKSREFIKKYNAINNVILFCHEPNVVKGDIGYRTILP